MEDAVSTEALDFLIFYEGSAKGPARERIETPSADSMAKSVAEEYEKILKKEDAEFAKVASYPRADGEKLTLQDREIIRILSAFKLDAYAILDVLPGCSTTDIRNVFRRKSLLIHPDKTTNPKAPSKHDRLLVFDC